MEVAAIAVVASVAAAVLIWAWRGLSSFWLRPKKLEKQMRQLNFQGNSYRFFTGDVMEEMSMLNESLAKPIPLCHDIIPRIAPYIHKHVSKYGKRSFLWYGSKPRLIIMNPETIKEILNKNIHYQKRKPGPLFKLFMSGLPSYEGDKWIMHRKLLNPAFHAEKLKCMVPVFNLCCSEMIKKWKEMIVEGNSYELDVWPSIQTLTSDVISRTAFGSSYEEGSRVFELQKEQSKLAMEAVRSVYVPGSRFLPTKRKKRMEEVDKQVRFLLRGIIDKKTRVLKSGEGSTDDLLGILLEANSKEVEHGNKSVGMSIDDVIEECKVFYFAGQETTAVLLVWTMILLSMHPSWQDRARAEVLRVISDDDKITVDHLNHLQVMTMILHEVLRLYPPVMALARRLHEETKLGDLTLPAEMEFMLPIILIHHDTDIWGADANEFKPERFSEGVSKATKIQTAAFFPFSGGPRICIGQNFAMLEAKLIMAKILKNFSFELSPSYTHAPISIVTVQPQYGATLILHKL